MHARFFSRETCTLGTLEWPRPTNSAITLLFVATELVIWLQNNITHPMFQTYEILDWVTKLYHHSYISLLNRLSAVSVSLHTQGYQIEKALLPLYMDLLAYR
jgi:hypothetical protein